MTTTEERAQHLAALDDDAFLTVLETDLHEDIPGLSEALAHPLVCRRWRDTLKSRLTDIQNQLAERRPSVRVGSAEFRDYKEWQRRALRYQQALLERHSVARRAVQVAPAPRRLPTPKPPRPRTATNRAIDRLIDAHAEEFQHYLSEERANDPIIEVAS